MDTSPHQLLAPALPRLAAAERLIVAYSGGLDSTVLLHAVARIFPPQRLAAAHVDHGLSPHSGLWLQHCRQVCQGLGIAFHSCRLNLDPGGAGLEQAARRGRYHFLAGLVAANELVLMAHHLDDQLETLLFRLLRGSGPRGLAAMPASRGLGAGALLRPLLAVPRSTLRHCARSWQLNWIEDESNAAVTFDRNYLRHQVLPAIGGRWPDYRQRLARTLEQCQGADEILRERAQQDLEHLGERRERFGHSLALAGFAALSPPRQQNVLREWVRSRGLGPLPHRVPDAVARELVAAREDASPLVSWPGGALRRHRGRLYVMSHLPPLSAEAEFTLSPGVDISVADGGRLEWQAATGGGLMVPAAAEVAVRFRRGGERCRPRGRGGSAALKKVLQEHGLEPWLRDRVPLLYVNGQLAAVGDLFVCEGFAARPGESGWQLCWRYPSAPG